MLALAEPGSVSLALSDRSVSRYAKEECVLSLKMEKASPIYCFT